MRLEFYMNNLNQSDIKSICREFFSASHGMLSWKWEDRFETALAQFDADKKERVRTILERYLRITWDSATIKKAPDAVQEINSRFNGLTSGQILFTSDPSLDDFIFCAWWPWNSGDTISIRIAPSCRKLSNSEKAGQIAQFRGWFGI